MTKITTLTGVTSYLTIPVNEKEQLTPVYGNYINHFSCPGFPKHLRRCWCSTKRFFDYGVLHQQPNLITAQLTVAFSHSELIVGDFWLIMGINCIRLLV